MNKKEDGFELFYNEFKDWTKKQLLHRTYDIILKDTEEIGEKDKEIEKLKHIKKQLEKNLQVYMQKDAENQLKIEKAIQREMELSYLCDTSPDEELLNILQGEDKDVKD